LIRLTYSRYKYVRANILALTCYFRQYSWLRRRRNSSKNLQGFAYSSRHCLLIVLEWAETEIKVLQGNNTFKLKTTLDRHNLRLIIDESLLADPPLFSLPSTFNGMALEKGDLQVQQTQ
jgi:hypothetical protein